jgi:phenylalanyl-tRNA synthetase beta chain
VRPYVVGAVLRNVTFTAAAYASFIDLQDKLHQNICRKRTLVAIGTHDLDTLSPPFRYEARAPEDIQFVPLSQSKSFRGDALIEFYRTDPSVKHIKPYVDIIASSPVYPVIYDSKQVVLSLPPLINGEHSKIKMETKNVFIECTATDLTKAHVVLNTVVCMFSEYCAEPFAVEPVEVKYEEPVRGISVQTTPNLTPRPAEARVSTMSSIVGEPITADQAVEFASKMHIPAKKGLSPTGEDIITVEVPPTRADVMHECDIVEDVAIAFGFNNIKRSLPKTVTVGHQQPVNKLTDALRRELAHAGYDETLTLALLSRAENYEYMNVKDPGDEAVVLANPKSADFQIGRTSMIPGLLKSLQSNRATALRDGVKIFEVSDVMLLDSKTDVGARNERHLAALYAGPTAGFEIIQGLLDRVMLLLEIPVRPYTWQVGVAASYGRGGWRYFIEELIGHASYFPGRAARVVLQKADGTSVSIGSIGVLHPNVLNKFEIPIPASVVELNIEPFL